MQNKSPRTKIRILKIQDGENVDFLRMPGPEMNFTKKVFFRIEIFLTSYEPEFQASRTNDDYNSFTILKCIA